MLKKNKKTNGGYLIACVPKCRNESASPKGHIPLVYIGNKNLVELGLRLG